MGDIFRWILPQLSEEQPEGEKERGKAEFEQKVARFLGPARFADYQLGKEEDYADAFRFTREKNLPKTVA